jgi:hypothetical protein
MISMDNRKIMKTKVLFTLLFAAAITLILAKEKSTRRLISGNRTAKGEQSPAVFK